MPPSNLSQEVTGRPMIEMQSSYDLSPLNMTAYQNEMGVGNLIKEENFQETEFYNDFSLGSLSNTKSSASKQ